MKKVFLVGILVLLVSSMGLFAYNNFNGNVSKPVATTQNATSINNISQQSPSPLVDAVAYKIEVVAQDLFVPWSMVFTSPERMLFTERNGQVHAMVNGVVQDQPLFTASPLSTGGEQGLMGMALHPEYETNKFVYLGYAYPANGGIEVRVDRLVDKGTKLTFEKQIIGNIPAASNHAGTRIRFGPDGKLYISTGDAQERAKAQDKGFLGGKILRLNDDGSTPSDNPASNSRVYSLGHRNPQGFDWHPVTRDMWETEHGPSVFDGPAGGDEVNLIVAGGNYGWPEVSHDKTDPRFESPKIVYTPAVAPASGMFYSGKMFPQFKNNFFFGGLRGEGIWRVVIDEKNPSQVAFHEKMPDINLGRIRDIAEGQDGSIYFSTSNQDGRGNPNAGDDKIYRIVKD